MNELRAAIEAILFAAGEPVQIEELSDAFPEESKETLVEQLGAIEKCFEENIGGFRLEQAAGGWRFATRPEQDPFLRKFFARKNEGRLSMAALETLAIVAYRQPITAPEISDIRGVNSSGVLRTLMERKMIRIAGRKNVVGSPFLYRTTRDFLTHFGLNDIRDLPRLEEFGDLLGENISEELIAGIGAGAMPSAEESEESEGAGAPTTDDAGGDAASSDDAREASGAGTGRETAQSSTPGEPMPVQWSESVPDQALDLPADDGPAVAPSEEETGASADSSEKGQARDRDEETEETVESGTDKSE